MLSKIGIRISDMISSVSKNVKPTTIIGGFALGAIGALGLFYLNKYLSPKPLTTIAPPKHPTFKTSQAASLQIARLCKPDESEVNLQSLATFIDKLITPLGAPGETKRFMSIGNTLESTPILVGKTETGWIVQPQEALAYGGFALIISTLQLFE
jgi:hypothetical protein